MSNAIIYPSKISGQVNAPASKSAGHRALICAALANANSNIFECGTSDDITATENALSAMGFGISRNGQTVTVSPTKINSDTVLVNCNESGSTLRFLMPVAAALGVNAIFTGNGRLPSRPIDTITDLLNANGVVCSSNHLPVEIKGKLRNGKYEIPGNISSQFISGFLMALSITEGESEIKIIGKLESAGYVDMTVNCLKKHGAKIRFNENSYFVTGQKSLLACNHTVEGDWSQAAFHLCAAAINGEVTVTNLDVNSRQGDKQIISVLKQFGALVEVCDKGITVRSASLNAINLDASQIPDIVPIIAVTSAFASGKTTISGAERLRIKESDRIAETVSRLNSFGIKACETPDGMTILGGNAHSATVSSANDHRIVMSFSVLASALEKESKILDIECINKSYPGYFSDMKLIGGKVDVIDDRQ